MRLLIVLLALFALAAEAKTQRSHQAKAEFRRSNPCPATGKTRGPCPGYVIDHIKPLCAGGPDHPSNLRWSAANEAKAKDVEELKLCRMMRRGDIPALSDAVDLCLSLSTEQWPHLKKALCADSKRAIGSN